MAESERCEGCRVAVETIVTSIYQWSKVALGRQHAGAAAAVA